MLLISVMALGLLLGLLGDFEMDEFESGGGVCLAALLGLLFFFALIAFAYLDKLLLRSRNKLHWIAPLGAGPLSLGGGCGCLCVNMLVGFKCARVWGS